MIHEFYRGRFIIALAIPTKTPELWAPLADISWTEGATPKNQRLHGPASRFATQEAVIDAARQMAKAWIDEQTPPPAFHS